MTAPVWPQKYFSFYKKVADHKDKICGGTVLAIDPSSGGTSLPGYAVFEAGILIVSGAIKFPKPKRDTYQRVQYLYDQVAALLPAPPDVLVIEEVHPAMSGSALQWAIGVSVAAARSPVTIELPINVWKALAKVTKDYVKDDAADAVMIGRSLVLLAQRDKGVS